MPDDEPVAFLGGNQGQGPAPEPKQDDDEVHGYLGGSAGVEDLPQLPGVEAKESYSANDLLEKEAPPEEADPYADPYATGAAAPPEAPPSEYDGYDASGAAEADPAYFDSMGHGESTATEPPPTTEEFPVADETDSPKTISQQDAESIIRRITTKRILPPETDKKPAPAASTKLTQAGSGVRLWPIILVLLVLGSACVYLFADAIAEAVPELRPLLFWLPPLEVPHEDVIVKAEDPQEKARKELYGLLIKSEAKAFGVAEKDVPPALAPGAHPAPPPPPATPPPGSPPPDSSAPTPGGG